MADRDWTRHLLPLPKRFCVKGSVLCAPDTLGVVIRGPDETLQQAARHLRHIIGAESVSQPTFSIELVVASGGDLDIPDVRQLTELPNPEQAYRIDVVASDTLRICGPRSVGVLYGAVTLGQLLQAGRQTDAIEVPLVEVLDWPDLQERGLWNFPDPDDWIPWMAGMKLNYGKMADTSHATMVRDEPGSAAIDADLYRQARRLGFSYVPYIVHLNFLHGIGLFEAYPELAGIGDAALAGRYFAHKEGDQHRAPCASQPVLVDLLCDWLTAIADQGADEISCWLSERPCQCQCERCVPVGQFLLETRAFLAAWRRAQAAHPQLTIRIFSSTTTPEQDDLILAELPPEAKFERACAASMDRVSRQPRDLFRNPLIDRAAADGRWVASYDVPIGAYGNVDTPEFKVPQYSAQRIRDFVKQLHERGYAGAYGMLAWSTMARQVCGFAVCALAEFSWNVNGRSVGEFAAAWATIEGISNPQAVADWAELLGEVEFDVYDADFPVCYSWGKVAEMVEEKRLPRFGEGMFRHFSSVEDFERCLETCERARDLVETLERPELSLATGVVASYVAMAEAIWHVCHRGTRADLSRLEAAGAESVQAIRAWRSCLGPEPWHHRVHDAIAATEATVQRILQASAPVTSPPAS
ncbi:MAG: glycoside hydrolase family 20 zincin-like fold domain-containing protein [Candidatus Latescibacteria bacterium]|jgi:hypothetical protein|nr:hypothetical protein [Gemmatimonadaceae bacterium]MDP6018709.1 glycoside hydrolase family 20 zincin-like fold domain-containing protein [Candidatus Latescibacterota bacterium]MDP7446990.1 glycoside hydrolase family 20 zincin-like fold domain-containing protein [Candidatus Latescibacterota bacterium]HJP32951.1 glycoside hydrolase family 20 zincin-like fold domain-containing protein [Candidatus Latescibacterota bacterium]